jgi:hypothetical protein
MSESGHTRVRKSTGRKRALYRSDTDEVCRACNGTIPAGQRFARGLTKEPYHHDCRRMGVRPPVPEPRIVVGSTIPDYHPNCAWCDEPIGDQKSITKDQLTYHRPCYLRMRT